MSLDLSEDVRTVDIKELMDILPHRYPFLFVDKILDLDLKAGKVRALKNVTINESYFQGHFPGAPIMPGVLILECLAQAGAILVLRAGDEAVKGKIAVLSNVKMAKFRRPIHPGDALELQIQSIHVNSKGGRVHARAEVDGQLAVEAEIGFVMVEHKNV